MRRYAAAFYVLLMWSCTVPATHTSQVRGPDGRDWWLVECRYSYADCLRHAGRLCPNGYVVGGRDSRDGPTVVQSLGTSTVVHTSRTDSILLACR